MEAKEFLNKIKPFIAIGIFIMLVTLAVLLYQENQITKEISENCEWGDEDFRCVCQKSDVIAMENMIKNNFSLEFENVTLVR